MKYKVVEDMPVAKFYYQGSHSHPIRRTVVIIESGENFIRGYEVREGYTVRKLKESPVKTFLLNKIATLDKLGARKHRKPGPNKTSLKRLELIDLLANGA